MSRSLCLELPVFVVSLALMACDAPVEPLGRSSDPGLGGQGLHPAVTDCAFTVSGTTMTLQADCTTDETLFIPDGFTLDGANRTIHAVDPPGGNFYGAVVRNAGATAHVTRLGITADVADVCATASKTRSSTEFRILS